MPVGWTVDTLGWKGTSGGITVSKIVSRVLGSLQPGEIVLMHCGSNPDDHSTLDADALPTIVKDLRARGYSFVSLDALRGLGYHVLTSQGGVHSFGAPNYGSSSLPPGNTGVALAADRATGGYWLLKSDGGVDPSNATWYGSLRGKLAAGADVGVAIGARGASASSEAADAVLTVDRLDRLGDVIALARRTQRIAVQSVLAGMLMSFASMAAAAAGLLPAVWARCCKNLST